MADHVDITVDESNADEARDTIAELRSKFSASCKASDSVAEGSVADPIAEKDLRHLVLKGVEELISDPEYELGTGGYGSVYKVKYCELICAAKKIHTH